jgi:prepilin peptidase dependent protein B
MLITLRKRQAGFTLVEMMVGIVVALVVLWGMSSVYLNTSRSTRTNANANQLNQDVRAVMDIMVGDIRRAGYWGNASSGGSNPFTASTPSVTDLRISGNCILYSYDSNGDGSVTAGTDVAGFRLSGTVVQSLDQTVGVSTTNAACAVDADWQNLTDERSITVSALTLDTVGSKCIALDPKTYNATDSTTYTTWTTTGGNGPACSASVANGGPATPPPTGNTFIETRQVRITLTAASVVDPTLTRTLTDTVLVRNNRTGLIP